MKGIMFSRCFKGSFQMGDDGSLKRNWILNGRGLTSSRPQSLQQIFNWRQAKVVYYYQIFSHMYTVKTLFTFVNS